MSKRKKLKFSFTLILLLASFVVMLGFIIPALANNNEVLSTFFNLVSNLDISSGAVENLYVLIGQDILTNFGFWVITLAFPIIYTSLFLTLIDYLQHRISAPFIRNAMVVPIALMALEFVISGLIVFNLNAELVSVLVQIKWYMMYFVAGIIAVGYAYDLKENFLDIKV